MINSSNHPIVESVINLSEGRNESLIGAVQDLLHRPGKVHLVHTDVGFDVNRTVFTLIGILEDLFMSIEELIIFSENVFDINIHEGTHPRIGILDVIPFIPLQNITWEELSTAVKQFSFKIGMKLKLPIFYYGKLATSGNRLTLAQLRKQWLNQLDSDGERFMIPDEGPEKRHIKLGASCVTVREFMVAFNINLDNPELMKAKELAKVLRKNRRTKTDIGEINIEKVRFLAWHMPEYGCNQISMNLYDITQVDLLTLYKYVERIAKYQNIELRGAELVGITPQGAICQETENMNLAIEYLGLNSVKPFSIEYHTLEGILPKLNWNL